MGWLKTTDPNVRLRVTSDNSVWVYRDIGNGRFAWMHEIEDAWEMMTPLAHALADCARHGHAWSADQLAHDRLRVAWRWCLVCGAESVTSPGVAPELIWPRDAGAIRLATAGTLPRLHGPLFRDSPGSDAAVPGDERLEWSGTEKEEVSQAIQACRAMTLGATFFREEEKIYG